MGLRVNSDLIRRLLRVGIISRAGHIRHRVDVLHCLVTQFDLLHHLFCSLRFDLNAGLAASTFDLFFELELERLYVLMRRRELAG